jgi:hypothetical protein
LTWFGVTSGKASTGTVSTARTPKNGQQHEAQQDQEFVTQREIDNSV